jgi:PhnB protein
MRISPHLCFDGQCEEAFRYYQNVLGGTIVTMLTYGASPLAPQTPHELHARIMHATLELDGIELTGVDVPASEYHRPQGFFVTLTIAEPIDARRIFQSLSVGGSILMQYQQTFWSAGFAVLVDRFGVPWEISCARPSYAAAG